MKYLAQCDTASLVVQAITYHSATLPIAPAGKTFIEIDETTYNALLQKFGGAKSQKYNSVSGLFEDLA